jgi:hypothetical protein
MFALRIFVRITNNERNLRAVRDQTFLAAKIFLYIAKNMEIPAAPIQPNRTNREILTQRELSFVEYMIEGATPAAAAVQAGWPAGPYASTVGNALARRADLVAMIQAGQARARAIVAERTGIELSAVVARIYDLAMRDPAGFFDSHGKPLPLDEVPIALRAAIEGIDVETVKERGVAVGEVTKYKLAKPTVALDMLMRHLGGYELDNRQSTDPLTELLREISGRRGTSQLGPRD